ncbi:MAG TPA: hypothetical protein VHO69_04445 [Phototrophicaceae bacterium]|nr:hypothetical protein [Phototrophicaceae bacterium]
MFDALSSLAEAVLAIAKGRDQAEAIFVDEPREYHWVFEQSDQVPIKILEFPKCFFYQTADKGKTIFEAQCPQIILVRAMIRCLADVLQLYGLDGYLAQWGNHEFPEKTYQQLRSQLKQLKQPPQ